MAAITKFIAEAIAGHRFVDAETALPFEDALAGLRVEGSVMLHGTHAPPWAVDVPSGARIRQMLGLGNDVLAIPFHLVLKGDLRIDFGGSQPVHLRQGQVVISPAGLPHRMGQGQSEDAHPFEQFLVEAWNGRAAAKASAVSGAAEVLCGGFVLRSAPLNPILSAMPEVMVIDGSGNGGSAILPHLIAMLQLELERSPRGGFVVSRLIEILFSEALKQHGRSVGHRPGWFRGLNDAKVGKALAMIHKAPGAPLSVPLLAHAVAMSPSRFAARFREETDQSVMSYVTRWRMNLACGELVASQKGLEQIAVEIGYLDVTSFSRAFKAAVGVSPAIWRRDRLSAG